MNEIKDTKGILLEAFFELRGNFKNFDKAEILEKKLKKYLEEKDDVHISYALTMLKIYVEELKFNDFEEACNLASPIIKTLSNTSISKLELYDIRFGQAIIVWTNTFEEAVILSKKMLSALKKYIEHELYYKIELGTNLNMSERLLKADFYEIDAGEEPERSKKVEEAFREIVDNITAICECEVRKEELRPYKLMTLIREATFNRDFKNADKYLNLLKETDEKALYKAMKSATITYSANVDIGITKAQLNARCGLNMRILRERLGLTVGEVADLLGYSESHISSMERGERTITSFQLYKIANRFNLTVNDFCYDIIDNKKASKEEIALEKLSVIAKGLVVDGIEVLCTVASQLQKQQRKLQKLQSRIEKED